MPIQTATNPNPNCYVGLRKLNRHNKKLKKDELFRIHLERIEEEESADGDSIAVDVRNELTDAMSKIQIEQPTFFGCSVTNSARRSSLGQS